MKFSCATQNSAFKMHPRDILQDEIHLYGIVLVHIIHKTVLVYVIGWMAVVFGINSASVVKRKE